MALTAGFFAPVYYNEHDAYAAQWLRNLIAAGHIAPGDVDERSIVDVSADDIKGYRQCHWFAGVAGWSLALRLAGFPDDRPVWTGSCPCQPFSAAGQGKAADDERHLWPDWFRLIRAVRPATIFFEQVEAAIGWGWLDLVYSDLAAEGYATRFAVLPACSVGAPHIRARLWGMADAQCGTAERWRHDVATAAHRPEGEARQRQRLRDDAGAGEHAGLVGDAGSAGLQERERNGRIQRDEMGASQGQAAIGGSDAYPWSDLVWLPCTDGKARPTQPGLFPLAHGISGRVGRLRAYGNAIVPQVAAEFIKTCQR